MLIVKSESMLRISFRDSMYKSFNCPLNSGEKGRTVIVSRKSASDKKHLEHSENKKLSPSTALAIVSTSTLSCRAAPANTFLLPPFFSDSIANFANSDMTGDGGKKVHQVKNLNRIWERESNKYAQARLQRESRDRFFVGRQDL
eukprot:TRINITY_DN1117_c0_g1_i2.p1 TRINITY_DN1117_c0_g1~~TRINITY_DN1117_c0_g1_i2.p1  ORF type:complete len:144 (-),score=19.55 TRINITY_DN1117_c0_g1_i2:37-468(-)